MGSRVMVNVVKGMSGGLAGNHAAHDQETGQNSKITSAVRDKRVMNALP